MSEGQVVDNIRWTLPLANVSQLAGDGTITGKVTLPGGAVAVSGDITAREKGSNLYEYSFASIYPDTFSLSVKANVPYILSYTPSAEEYYVASTYYPNATSSRNAAPITVAENGRFTANIQAQPGGSIGGFVVDAQGKPVGEALAGNSFYEEDACWYYALATNASDSTVGGLGSLTEFSGFRVPSLTPGTYDVRLVSMAYASGADAVFDYSAQRGRGLPQSGSVRMTVTAGQTAITGSIALSAASGTIAGTFDGRGSPLASTVEMMLVDGNGRLVLGGVYLGASYEMFPGYLGASETARDSALYAILGYDLNTSSQIRTLSANGGDIIHYALPGLPTGAYYLAAAGYNPYASADAPCLTWYGTTECAAYPYYMSDKISVPPDAVAIHVTDGQTTGNINFGPGSGARQRGALAASAFGLRRTGASPRGVPVLSYTTGNRAKPAELSVFSVDGRRVYRIVLAAESGTVAWDGKDAGGRAASAGCYLFCLTSGDQRAVVRGNVVR